MRANCRVFWLACSCIITACGGGSGSPANSSAPSPAAVVTTTPAPPSPDPVPKGPAAQESFRNVTATSGIEFVSSYNYPWFSREVADSTLGGAAAGDCDADGDIDLFITYGDGIDKPNRLYLNLLDIGLPLQFEDQALAAGVAYTRSDGMGNDRHSGPTFADFDGDGDLDLFLGGLYGDANMLYRNRGDCTFDDVTAGSGLDELIADQTISAAFGDYDLDGDLDLFLTHWRSLDEFAAGEPSEHLFRNESDSGSIRFENASLEAGVTAILLAGRVHGSDRDDTDFTYTPGFALLNDDLLPDIAVAADFGTTQLLLNDPANPGHFVDGTNDAIRSVDFGMGHAIGDYDNDGDLDWFVTSIMMDATSPISDLVATGNRLLANPGGDLITNGLIDATANAGVANGDWAWGTCFLDVNNDRHLDIYLTNGWYQSIEDRSRLFIADGQGQFFEAGARYGVDDQDSGRSIVCADFDNDGDMDILQLTNNQTNSATLWQNDMASAGSNYLRIKLLGLPPNTEAAGARIYVTTADTTQMREIAIGNNFASQNPTVQVIGLGVFPGAEVVKVEWPPTMQGSGPERPAPWTATLVSASLDGETLMICHPALNPVPSECQPDSGNPP